VLQNPGDVEEQGPPFIIKSQAASRRRKGLAGESRDEQVEIRQRGRFDLRDVTEGPVGEVSLISPQCPFVDLGVADTVEVDAQLVAGGGQAKLETADAGEQGKVADGGQWLPSGYDVTMKKGIQRFKRAIDDNVRGMLFVLLYPASVKDARVHLCAWSFALVLSLTSVGLFISDGSWTSPWLWLNIGLAAIEVYLLRRAYLGYRWVRGRRARRRA